MEIACFQSNTFYHDIFPAFKEEAKSLGNKDQGTFVNIAGSTSNVGAPWHHAVGGGITAPSAPFSPFHHLALLHRELVNKWPGISPDPLWETGISAAVQ